MEDMRIKDHPILGKDRRKEITFCYEGISLKALEGDSIAAALTANGINIFRYTVKTTSPRAYYCANGQCMDCMMIVNGVPFVRACITKVEDGMDVRVQHGMEGNKA